MSGCSSYFFYPMKELVQTPEKGGLKYDDIEVTTEDGLNIHGWLLKAEQPKGIVFFLHGNAENISTHIGSVHWLPAQGYDVVLMDYRGYGRSEGKPDIPDVFLDVDAMYRWLAAYSKEKQLPVYILGQSLGAAISSYYFSQLPPEKRIYDGIVLDSIFTGHKEIAKHMLSQNVISWPFQFVVPFFLPSEYNPIDHVAELSPSPLLFFHSRQDNVLPYSQGKRVFQSAQEPKYWVATKGPHIATFNAATNQKILLNFFNDPTLMPTGSTPNPTDLAQTDWSSSHNQK